MKLLLILFLLTSVCYAQEIPVNQKYSYQDLSSRSKIDFRKVPIEEINNTEIIGSGFGNKGIPYSKCFPDGMTGVIFTRCNLDNCIIPDGNIIGLGCTNKQHKAMNDGENWIIDKDLKPVEPLHKDRFEKYGLSTDPKDIPTSPLKESVTQTASKGVIQ